MWNYCTNQNLININIEKTKDQE